MDTSLVEKHLAHVASSVDLLRRLGQPDRLASDPVQFGFVVHTLQTAVQSAIDVAAIIASERKLGEPDTNRQLFEKLAQDGWLGAENTDVWSRIVAFRNIVVHRYLQVDPRVVRAILTDHLDDLLTFVSSIRRRLGEVSG